MLLVVPDSFYAYAQSNNPFKCTEKEREEFFGGFGADGVAQICDSQIYVDDKLMDRALHDFITTCRYCTHALLLDARHGFIPEFLNDVMEQDVDIAIEGSIEGGMDVTAHIDVGAIVLRPRVLKGGHRMILTLLPEGTRARELLNADYWFVKHAMECGYSHALIEDKVSASHQEEEA